MNRGFPVADQRNVASGNENGDLKQASSFYRIKGVSFYKETMLLRWWGVLQDNLVLSTGLRM